MGTFCYTFQIHFLFIQLKAGLVIEFTNTSERLTYTQPIVFSKADVNKKMHYDNVLPWFHIAFVLLLEPCFTGLEPRQHKYNTVQREIPSNINSAKSCPYEDKQSDKLVYDYKSYTIMLFCGIYSALSKNALFDNNM